MSFEDDNSDWFKRRRAGFPRDWAFSDIDKLFHDMEKMMEDEFKELTSNLPKDYIRERKLPDGSTAREFGPFVYGYSMKIGPNGRPEISEFGNLKATKDGPKIKEEREPLVDIIETNGEIHVVVELPGVDKQEINLHGDENSLTISVDTSQRKYFKEVTLPFKVKINEAKSSYKNGVLEVVIPKKDGQTKPKGQPIDIA